jgi:hypothetical protein
MASLLSLRRRFVLSALARRIAPVFVLLLSAALAPSALACAAGAYTYAGVAGSTPVSGVGARITPSLTGFNIVSGHVAGWVGVGGPGQGPNGTDEWIQVGLSAFPNMNGNDVYYEVAQPGAEPTYHRVTASVAAGVPLRVAVLEMRSRLDWWRVWVNGSAVSQPIFLPASNRRWQPIVTAESWDGGAVTCNDFLYSFQSLSIARAPGGRWTGLGSMAPIENANYSRVLNKAPGAFYAAGGPFGLRTLAGTDSFPPAPAPQP